MAELFTLLGSDVALAVSAVGAFICTVIAINVIQE